MTNKVKIKMEGVTEYVEGDDVYLTETEGTYVEEMPDDNLPGRGRLVIKAINEGGFGCTEVDLLELLAWVKANRPDLISD
tara:strand:- start:308 stop:547 length:240 start_codon:yes stop_codon:yes gene_type:complete